MGVEDGARFEAMQPDDYGQLNTTYCTHTPHIIPIKSSTSDTFSPLIDATYDTGGIVHITFSASA